MKQLISIIILLVGMGSTRAQTPPKYTERLDSIICTDDMKRTMKYELSYDEEGHFSQVQGYLWKDGWQTEGKRLYFYDENGHNIRLEDYSFGNGMWEKLDKMEARYDSLGNLVEEFLFLAKADEWEPFTKDIHSYGADGKHTGTLHYYHDDGGWILDGKWEKQFNEKRQVVENMEYRKEGEAWEERLKVEYEYDEEGNEIMYASYSMSDHGWIGYDRFCRTYDEKGMKKSEKRYYWGREGTWEDGGTTSILRDAQGNVSSRKVSTTEGGIIDVRTYTYDLDQASSRVMGLQSSNLLYRYVWDSPVNSLNEYACKILYWKETDSEASIIQEQTFFYSPIM